MSKKLSKNAVEIFCVVSFIVLLILVGNVIFIANQIQNATNEYFAYAFYVLLLVLLIKYILIPIIKLLKMPSLGAFTFSEVDGLSRKTVEDIADKLVYYYPDTNNDENKEEEKIKFIEDVKKNKGSGYDVLCEIVNEEIKKRKEMIDDKIKKYRNRVFILTSISQNNRFDTLSVWILNFRMIKDLIESTGFRPSYYQMFQIYWRVLATGAFAYATSEVVDAADDSLSDISAEIASKIGFDFLGSVIGLVAKSFVDGAVNALFTWRLGLVTKQYLEKGFDSFDDEQKRTKIYQQSVNYCKLFIDNIKKAS